jgi:hypothetical protein
MKSIEIRLKKSKRAPPKRKLKSKKSRRPVRLSTRRRRKAKKARGERQPRTRRLIESVDVTDEDVDVDELYGPSGKRYLYEVVPGNGR